MDNEILNLENLSVGYSQPVCSDINATVKKGELVGLIGKNGSGKSTLIRSLLGLQPLLSGKIELNHQDISTWNEIKRAKEMAVVFSRLDYAPGIPVHELVALGRLPHRNWMTKLDSNEREILDNAIDLVGINHLKNSLASELSDGQLQMVMIARALVQDTQLIIMDEPTSHLDIENQFKIFELIYRLSQETGKTFIISTHQIELLMQNTTQFWWLNDGNFHAGYPEQIAYENKIFETLSQENITFDYEKGTFRFRKLKHNKVKFSGDESPLAFWTKHALERNGFDLSDDGIEIVVSDHQIKLGDKSFQSLSSFMEALRIFDTSKNQGLNHD